MKKFLYIIITLTYISLAFPQWNPFMPDTNTLGLWHLDEGNGTTFYDETSNENHGNIIGAQWTSDGKFSDALQFDGNGDYLLIPISNSLITTTNKLTIEMWFKQNPNNTGHSYELWRYGTNIDITSAKVGENALKVTLRANGITYGYLSSLQPINNYEWYHVAFCYDGEKAYLFINGELNDEMVINGTLDEPDGYIWIARNGYAYYPRYFNGTIDEIRISNNARYVNKQPVANAGKDTTIEATSCSATTITLDGSQSYDPDNDSLSFRWYIDDSLISTTATPTIELPIGTTEIHLIVNDGIIDSNPDTVLVTVVDTTPPTITASLDTLDVHGNKVNYIIHFTANDLCDPNPTITGVIELPEMNNPELKFKNKKHKKIKVDLKKNSVKVEADEPENFWEEVENDRGISVKNGQEIEMKFKKNKDKYEYKFDNNDELEKVTGHEITLFCIAKDFYNNIDSIRVTITYENEEENENNEVEKENIDLKPLTVFDYELKQNIPNPFNPQTTIYFSIPTTEFVSLEIFNVQGQKIRTLLNGIITNGLHVVKWDGKNEFGQNVTGGLYIYRLKAGSFVQTKKMLLIK